LIGGARPGRFLWVAAHIEDGQVGEVRLATGTARLTRYRPTVHHRRFRHHLPLARLATGMV
jgi:hypothetical protein